MGSIDNENYLAMIKNISARGILKTPRIINAFMEIDRENFVDSIYKEQAYEDKALPIKAGQTISQPSTVAFMIELLDPQPGDNVLDIGSGSAWTTALLAHIVRPNGNVVGVEIMPELVEFGLRNIQKYFLPNAKLYPATKDLGYPSNAPYNKILVSAQSNEIPDELLSQLKDGGVMVLPLNSTLVKVEKVTEDEIKTKEYPGYVFVPLINPTTSKERTNVI